MPARAHGRTGSKPQSPANRTRRGTTGLKRKTSQGTSRGLAPHRDAGGDTTSRAARSALGAPSPRPESRDEIEARTRHGKGRGR
jgi:hypothetical protein